MTGQPDVRVRFNVLGSLESWAGDTRLRLGGPLQERVLVMLLLEPGRVVPVTRLVAAAWEDEPPATASHQVRKAVADLRRRIPGGGALILTDGPGYRAVVTEEQLDLHLFTALGARARAALARGGLAEAEEALRAALALWRGPVLSGAGGALINAASTALEERRLAAAEQLFQLRLERGEAAELVGDLREFIAAHPLRETLRGHVMLALYRSGRQAEALEEFTRVRELLVEELGIDPGPQLTSLYEDILRDSPSLAAPPSPAAAAPNPATGDPAAGGGPVGRGTEGGPVASGSDGGPVPARTPASPSADAVCTLPYDLADFTGRQRELALLLAQAGTSGERTRIVAVDGMGGSGKTSLAVHAAHRLAEHYPDGQLHIDLRGHTPGEQPMQPAASTAALLRTLDVPGEEIPENAAGRAALWRSTLAGRRMLLLLDNAADAAQVRPLLPASPGCLVLITSRARLVELDGAQWISVGMMPPEESLALITETLGKDRAEAEPAAVRELAALCGQLPLALRISTARLRNRPRWTVRDLVGRLRDESRRLAELSSRERSVAASLQLSYQTLDEAHRTAFRLLSLHPGADMDVESTAALLDLCAGDAEDVLEYLLDMHLVQQHEVGRYALHDLVRSFAQSLLNADTAQQEHLAFERLLDYYLSATEAACAVLFPGRPVRDSGLPGSAAALPQLDTSPQAERWLDRERDALRAAIVTAEARGWARHAVYLARNMIFYYNLRSSLEEYQEVGQLAIAAARTLQDPPALLVSLSNVASVQWRLGRPREGLRLAEETHKMAVGIGDAGGICYALNSLGMLHTFLGNLPEALRCTEEALALMKENGTAARKQAEVLCNLSTLHTWFGRHAEAVATAEEAMALYREIGDVEQGAAAVNDLAIALLAVGSAEKALGHLEQALKSNDESRPENYGIALALAADAAQCVGDTGLSQEYATRADALVRTRSTLLRRATAENVLGRMYRRRGDHRKAFELHESALLCASETEFRMEMARALDGMALATEALGDATAARQHRERAQVLYGLMGLADVTA